MRITITLSNRDLNYFRSLVHNRLQQAPKRTDEEIIHSAVALLEHIQTLTLSDFIAQKMHKLKIMVRMLNDTEWQIPQIERARVLTALSYFSDPHDLIPDAIPVLGYLDDAIIIELMVRELKHEIDAFEDFGAFCDRQANTLPSQCQSPSSSTSDTPARVERKRQSLQQRMRKRTSRQHHQSESQLSLF